MNRPIPNSGSGRRRFLCDGLRLTLLAGLAAVGGKLITRNGLRRDGQVCAGAGICSGCDVFDDCGLPQALSAKAARNNLPSS